MNAYITTGEAARDLGVSSSALTRWAAAGLVTPARRTAGGHYRWDLEALRAQLRQIPHSTDQPRTTAEDIASVIHQANRQLQIVIGEPHPSPPWDEAPDYQARQCIAGVELYLANPNLTPEQSHEAWCDRMRAEGWTHGNVKNETAKTHPLLVPWDQVPAEHQRKDLLFAAIVRALAP